MLELGIETTGSRVLDQIGVRYSQLSKPASELLKNQRTGGATEMKGLNFHQNYHDKLNDYY
jgi:hypothetical protein